MDETNFIRKQLGHRLRFLRNAVHLSRRDVEKTGAIRSTRILKALEDGKSTTVTFPIINELCRLYRTTDPMRRETERMFREVRSAEWREQPIQNWIDDTALFIQAESLATQMYVYEPLGITGLLQTERYVHARMPNEMPPEQVNRLIAGRLERQRRFWSEGACRDARILLTQDAFEAPADQDQIEKLRREARRSNLSVNIQDDQRSYDDAYRYPFIVLRFEDDQNACVYTETVSAHRYESQERAVDAYLTFFETLFSRSTPLEEYLHAHVTLA